jgi:hypothetical protein
MKSASCWIFANGEFWAVFDSKTQNFIEELWEGNKSGYVSSGMFANPVYIDIHHMVLLHEGFQYTIVRQRASNLMVTEDRDRVIKTRTGAKNIVDQKVLN